MVPACKIVLAKSSKNDNDTAHGTIDKVRFKNWLNNKLCPNLGESRYMEDRSIVILDNATIHHDEEIIAMIRATGAEIIYLPQYLPDKNPIEPGFFIYKSGLKRQRNMDFACAHINALNQLTPLSMNNFYAKANVPGVKKILTKRRKIDDMLDNSIELLLLSYNNMIRDVAMAVIINENDN